MKKIVFLLTQSLDSPGGGGRYWPLAKALTKRGFSVSIVALHPNITALPVRKFKKEGVSIHYVSQMHVKKVAGQKIYYKSLPLLWITLKATMRLFWAAHHERADIIHVGKTQPMNGVAAWGNHLFFGTPVFLDSDDYEAINNRFSGPWQKRVVALFEDWLPSFAHGISVGTHYIGARFAANGYPETKIQLVHNGFDQARFAILDTPDIDKEIEKVKMSLDLPKEGQFFVYVGSMSLTSHAIDLLLEALAIGVKRRPQLFLILVGSGEDLALLKQLAVSLGLSKNSRFLGKVSLEQVPLYFRLGAFTVDPMRYSTAAESSLSLKLVESIAAGVPCLTSDIGDRRAVVGQAGTAVPPDDAHILADTIIEWFDSPQTLEKMGQAAKKLAPLYDWDSRSEQIVTLYKTGLGERWAPPAQDRQVLQ